MEKYYRQKILPSENIKKSKSRPFNNSILSFSPKYVGIGNENEN